ncbi:MAG TPA: TetR/AcrR family transcriptional regulator [Gemmatimonadaceae bacterium]|jgi:AcrR family transcriptional regulator
MPTKAVQPSTRPRAPRDADATRRGIIEAAFLEFYRNSFQAGSINDIITAAGITKGALFHHFATKQALGYTVLDELIGPLLATRWLAPLENTADPIADLQRTFRKYVKEDIDSGSFVHGCPLNNLAQEMSPLDDGFHSRIDELYDQWRKGFATALAAGIKNGSVRKDVSPKAVASMLVAGQMGIWGSGKSSRSKAIMMQANEALCDYLGSMKA